MRRKFLVLCGASVAGSTQSVAQVLNLGRTIVVPPPKFGAQDDREAELIAKVNEISALRRAAAWDKLQQVLEQRLRSESDDYAKSRVLNELADVCGYLTLDLESAIRHDTALLAGAIPADDTNRRYHPQHAAANQLLVQDPGYVEEYVAIRADAVRENAQRRLAINTALLAGKKPAMSGSYTRAFLLEQVEVVRRDIGRTPPGTLDRLRLYSRLVRMEYEILAQGHLDYRPASEALFASGEIGANTVDLGEIDFLRLSEYFVLLHGKGGNLDHARRALEVVYRPYLQLRAEESRWRYNVLVNGYISRLVRSAFEQRLYGDAFYYLSLNKSRMILEDQLIASGTNRFGLRMRDLLQEARMPLEPSGLPQRTWFLQKLRGARQFLDFHIDGAYEAGRAGAGSGTGRERALLPFTARNVAVISSASGAGAATVFSDRALYVTVVGEGRVASMSIVQGGELAAFRDEMEKSYDAVSSGRAIAANARLRALGAMSPEPALRISPDKWLAKHPFDLHLGKATVRAVNFFVAEDDALIGTLKVAGFLNPELRGGQGNLPGADREAAILAGLFGGAALYKGADASVSNLGKVASANIIHLSMHGSFNGEDPSRSKLFFAGSAFDDRDDDPRALFASDMRGAEALQGKDLIFAAACQTGLTGADRRNASELTGIVRPLVAGRNRNLVLSLWNVDDVATSEFVKAFYEQLARSNDVADAFAMSQGQLRQKYPNPYIWAAFYLMRGGGH